MAAFKFYLFGHSFPKRLASHLSTDESVESALKLPEDCSIVLDGYSGLTFQKVLRNPTFYFMRLRDVFKIAQPDVIIVDLGTNDLCDLDVTAAVLIHRVIEFIHLLQGQGVTPKHLIFLSIIQRTKITRQNQVTIQNFNHRVKKFNRSLSEALKSFPFVSVFAQTKLNFPKYLDERDGVHLNSSGTTKYCNILRSVVVRYKTILQSN